jgi:hypothetical protein
VDSKERSNLVGVHAFLSASKYSWLNYPDEKLDRLFHTSMDAARGTRLHSFAHEAIALGRKMPDTRTTLDMYINDAIGFRMKSEQVLYYSRNAFGTADTIKYTPDKKDSEVGLLRIHDLKNGITEASMKQLLIYVALFCLDFNKNPHKLESILRIYQNDAIEELVADPHEVFWIMEKIKYFDKRIEMLRLEAMS